MDDLQYIAAIEDLEIAEQPVERHNRFENLSPFEILNEDQFLQTFRLTKELCRFVIDTLTPFMRPQRRATDLSIRIRVLGKNIQDLCYGDRQENKTLKKHLNSARSKGYLAKIRGQTLVVNNEAYSVEQLRNLEQEEEDLKNSPTPNLRAVSEPSTPTTNQTFLEDSLQLFFAEYTTS
ncbi:hypothetical protein JTB14_024398 [Gonioctena quinquepunctata]|nr:hypothetical protein JTB14_024398 [Gonioctena quinquepunctata]